MKLFMNGGSFAGCVAGCGILLIMVFLGGCASGSSGYAGRLAAEDNRIVLLESTEPIRGIWRSPDIALDYSYLFNSGSVRFSGGLTLADKLMHFTAIDHLYFRIHFLDPDGRVLTSGTAYVAPHRHWISLVRLTFDRTFEVPPGAVAFGFSYTGEVTEGQGGVFGKHDGGISWEFWKQP